MSGLGKHSQYSDLVWAGWSEDQIPLEARFSAPIQSRPEAPPASYTMGTTIFWGVESSRGMVMTTHPHLVPRLKKE